MMDLKCFIFILLTLSVLLLENAGQKYIYKIEKIAKSQGYVMETHHFMTTDGYLLSLHRIPFKRRAKKGNLNRPVVLLMHGMFSASDSFIYLGPDNSIAYNLADAGFDVWMGNARGTKNSRYHEDLQPDNPADKAEFFDLTYEEIGVYDLAEMVDLILSLTENEALHYIGLGAGGTAFLVLNSLRPEYDEKFSSAHLLAGAGYQRHFRNKLLISLATFTNTYYRLWKSIGLVELFPPGSADNALTGLDVPRYCTGNLIYGDVCELMGVQEIMGTGLLNALVDSETAGASVKQVAHFGQNIKSKKFSRWDYGHLGNMDMYGTENPPEYDLSLVTVNVTLHYSKADHLVYEQDVFHMADAMPNCNVRKVPKSNFKHFDYIINPEVKMLVTDFIVKSIKTNKYSSPSSGHRDIFQSPLGNLVLGT